MTGSQVEREAALVARWGAGAYAGRWLRAATGERLAVLFPGRSGGPAGPDFRDAVLLCSDGSRIYGDVEVHLWARGWHAHGHATDRRYNGVVLHVVRHAEGARATRLASGAWVPLLELDLDPDTQPVSPAKALAWPCAELGRRQAPGLRALLRQAGLARLEDRAADFERTLRQSAARTVSWRDWSEADNVLFVALAEGLAYGREREALREAGTALAAGSAPEVLLRELARLPALDARRLEGLLTLYERWCDGGPWLPLVADLATGTVEEGVRALIAAMTVAGGLVSPGRAAILSANVVLPFALAMAATTGDGKLAERAHALYLALPGLQSNQITRAMRRQLGLARAPAGACAQQGLHHIWTHWCREKRCEGCPCAHSGSGARDELIASRPARS